jgi:putative transposase
MDNSQIESFTTRMRDECLDAHAFELRVDAEETLPPWQRDHNAARPRSAKGMLAPRESA